MASTSVGGGGDSKRDQSFKAMLERKKTFKSTLEPNQVPQAPPDLMRTDSCIHNIGNFTTLIEYLVWRWNGEIEKNLDGGTMEKRATKLEYAFSHASTAELKSYDITEENVTLVHCATYIKQIPRTVASGSGFGYDPDEARFAADKSLAEALEHVGLVTSRVVHRVRQYTNNINVSLLPDIPATIRVLRSFAAQVEELSRSHPMDDVYGLVVQEAVATKLRSITRSHADMLTAEVRSFTRDKRKSRENDDNDDRHRSESRAESRRAKKGSRRSDGGNAPAMTAASSSLLSRSCRLCRTSTHRTSECRGLRGLSAAEVDEKIRRRRGGYGDDMTSESEMPKRRSNDRRSPSKQKLPQRHHQQSHDDSDCRSRSPRCDHCGRRNHASDDCPEERQRIETSQTTTTAQAHQQIQPPAQQLFCTLCQRQGHATGDCLRERELEEWRTQEEQKYIHVRQQQQQQQMTLAQPMPAQEQQPEIIVLDDDDDDDDEDDDDNDTIDEVISEARQQQQVETNDNHKERRRRSRSPQDHRGGGGKRSRRRSSSSENSHHRPAKSSKSDRRRRRHSRTCSRSRSRSSVSSNGRPVETVQPLNTAHIVSPLSAVVDARTKLIPATESCHSPRCQTADETDGTKSPDVEFERQLTMMRLEHEEVVGRPATREEVAKLRARLTQKFQSPSQQQVSSTATTAPSEAMQSVQQFVAGLRQSDQNQISIAQQQQQQQEQPLLIVSPNPPSVPLGHYRDPFVIHDQAQPLVPHIAAAAAKIADFVQSRQAEIADKRAKGQPYADSALDPTLHMIRRLLDALGRLELDRQKRAIDEIAMVLFSNFPSSLDVYLLLQPVDEPGIPNNAQGSPLRLLTPKERVGRFVGFMHEEREMQEMLQPCCQVHAFNEASRLWVPHEIIGRNEYEAVMVSFAGQPPSRRTLAELRIRVD